MYAAATAELSERGFDAFSMRSVARRSGVARPSLMLRWPDRDALILDTLERLEEWPQPDPTASVREEVDAILARVAQLMAPEMLSVTLRLVADAPQHPALFAAFQEKVIAKAGKRLTDLLRRAVAEGELPETTDARWAADALIGVMFMRTIRSAGRRPPTRAVQREIVEALWSGLSVR